MHHECLEDAVLRKVYDRLGQSTPHIQDTKDSSDDPKATAAVQQEPMSPWETPTLQTEATIDVVGADTKPDTMAPASWSMEDASFGQSMPNGVKSSNTLLESVPAYMEPSPGGLDATAKKINASTKKRGRNSTAAKEKPYLGLFEAELRMNQVPVVWEITDLRNNVPGGVKVWTESASCLVCNSTIE